MRRIRNKRLKRKLLRYMKHFKIFKRLNEEGEIEMFEYGKAMGCLEPARP